MKIIDLSHLIHEEMTVYPGTQKPRFIPLSNISADGFVEHRLEFSSHTGTHLDAPAHMVATGLTLDHIPADRFVGPGWICDVSHKSGQPIGVENLYLPQGIEFLLLYSGWDRNWDTPAYHEGYPFLSEEAVDWLIGKDLKGIGFDMISADPPKSPDYHAHTNLLGNNILLIENLKNLDVLLNKTFLFACLPLNWHNGDGSPVRAIGITDL